MNVHYNFLQKLKVILFKQKAFYKPFKKIKGKIVGKRIEADKKVPCVELKHEHIQNLKTLLNREDLLNHLPKNKVIAEIGVDRGDFSELILKHTAPNKLHLIDAWGGGRYNSELKQLVKTKFKTEISNAVVELNVGLSTDVLATMPDHYFDWVYLDTDHSYSVTRSELNVLKNKVKRGGIIAGHDYIGFDFIAMSRYGVIEAVNEFCVNQNWEILYLTSETNQYRSFAIREIAKADQN